MTEEYVKCPNCNWLHYVVEDGKGEDRCFRCNWSAVHMVPADEKDYPKGINVNGVNRSEYGRGLE